MGAILINSIVSIQGRNVAPLTDVGISSSEHVILSKDRLRPPQPRQCPLLHRAAAKTICRRGFHLARSRVDYIDRSVGSVDHSDHGRLLPAKARELEGGAVAVSRIGILDPIRVR